MSETPKLVTEWYEVGADKVVAHFVKDYERKPVAWEWFFDAGKRRFIFRVTVPAPESPSVSPPLRSGTTE